MAVLSLFTLQNVMRVVLVCITAIHLFQLNLIHASFRCTALSILSIRKPLSLVNSHTFGICWLAVSAHPTPKGICILHMESLPFGPFGSRWLEVVAVGLGFNAQQPLQSTSHPAQLLPAHAPQASLKDLTFLQWISNLLCQGKIQPNTSGSSVDGEMLASF